MSTIRRADQVFAIEEGRVVERGTHAELMALDGRYRKLHDRQYRTEMNRFVNPCEALGPAMAAREARTGLSPAGGQSAPGASSSAGRMPRARARCTASSLLRAPSFAKMLRTR